MKTIPMLNICTPPPDMYSMNACMGRDFAGAVAKSIARFSLIALYASGGGADVFAPVRDCGAQRVELWEGRLNSLNVELTDVDFEKPGGGGRFRHLTFEVNLLNAGEVQELT
jgi:hypothetical protein